jgi:hypothetical protein
MHFMMSAWLRATFHSRTSSMMPKKPWPLRAAWHGAAAGGQAGQEVAQRRARHVSPCYTEARRAGWSWMILVCI